MLLGGGAGRRGVPVRARASACYGGWAVLAFGLLAAYTALSILWSLAPADSWSEANRVFAYLAAFAGARRRSCGCAPGAGRSSSTGVLAGP